MKRIILLTLLIVLSFSNGHAQNNVRDSLRQLLKHGKEDTSRVLQLASLSFQFIESNPDTTMILAMKALSLSEKLGFEKGKAVSLNKIGNALNATNNYPKAMEMYLQALQINEKIHNDEGMSANLGNIGLIYSSQENYRLALIYYFKSKELSEKLNNYQSLSSTNSNIAGAYRSLKIYDSARLYAQQAYDIAIRINYPRIIGSALNTLGMIHFELSQYNSALEHYRLSIPFCKEANNDGQLANLFLNMAKVFEKFNLPDSMFYYARQSVRLAKEIGSILYVRDAARLLSFINRKHNTDSSFFYQDIARACNDSIFSQQKQQQLQNMAFDENLRQKEMEVLAVKVNTERKINLQYAMIFVGLISFVILFIALSRSFLVNERFIKFFGILGLLAVFEFINLYIHPYLDKWTNHTPFLMLAILIGIGALLIPLHHKMEKWITMIMVGRNKIIRLEAARKTIAQLEKETIS